MAKKKESSQGRYYVICLGFYGNNSLNDSNCCSEAMVCDVYFSKLE